jgi:hypothetical protein
MGRRRIKAKDATEKERLDMCARISEVTGAKVITHLDPRKCELCGKLDELRPYGPMGESVCYDCGMKDENAVERGMKLRLGF